MNAHVRRRKLHVEIEHFPLKRPFRITARTVTDATVFTVTLSENGAVGRGEAAGVYYRGDTAVTATQQLEEIRPHIEGGTTRLSVAQMLPPGGARNALDCALWDLEAKIRQSPVWCIAGLPEPRPLLTTFTVGADTPREMASIACGYQKARAIKLKLTGEPDDADRVRAVREVRPDVWLAVDANQGLTPALFNTLLPTLVDADVAQIEQPFPAGKEHWLDDIRSPIPIVADESIQSLKDLDFLVGKVSAVNIKLDKCGGLTEALAIAHRASALGFELMVGNMIGTSLAMAPSYLIGQLCGVIDLDGPIFLQQDRSPAVTYDDGMICCPESVWGAPR